MPGGGDMKTKGVMGYQPPKGPTDMMHKGPGLGGHNCGPCGTQGYAEESSGDGQTGSPGLHGTNHGSAGTQGRH